MSLKMAKKKQKIEKKKVGINGKRLQKKKREKILLYLLSK